MSGKKLINKVEDVVDEALDGLTMINPGIRRIKGHRVLLRETVTIHFSCIYISIYFNTENKSHSNVNDFILLFYNWLTPAYEFAD